ncbi:uncharacterized protein LOC143297030 isoform X2 [Babylonia areolata]|uniref:uncharacterized protein LOC143297030 isoform X2 n=1 Tax=Babylonia areolata TaxID=304850 RepID=UPI003FD67ECF
MDYNVSATAMNHTLNHTLNHTMNHTAINSSSPAEDVTLNVFERYTVSQLVETFAPAAAWAERVVPPIWYFVGFFGNPVSAYVWLGARMRRNNSSAVYLGLLAVSDLVFLFLHLLHTLHVTWGRDVYNAPGGCEAFMFFFYIPQYLSVVLVAAFTVERYVAVCHPFLKEKWCTERRAFLAVGACTGLSAALSTAQLYIWTFFPTLNICNTRPQAAEGGDASFWNVWTWVVDMLLFALLPLVVLLFNALVLREIVRLSRNGIISRQVSRGGGGGGGDGGGGGSGGTTASTLTLLCVSFFLIVTQLAATLVNTLQSAYPPGPHLLTDLQLGTDATWRAFFTYLDCRKVLETLCLSHYSCYFFVYCLTGKHFRREVRHLLTCQGRLSCGSRRGRRGERYSMVSSNGHSLNTTNCTMAFTTSI